MQISADGLSFYDCRQSKDKRYEYTIMSQDGGKTWDVDCWIVGGESDGANHWNKQYTGAGSKDKALAEFNRFE